MPYRRRTSVPRLCLNWWGCQCGTTKPAFFARVNPYSIALRYEPVLYRSRFGRLGFRCFLRASLSFCRRRSSDG